MSSYLRTRGLQTSFRKHINSHRGESVCSLYNTIKKNMPKNKKHRTQKKTAVTKNVSSQSISSQILKILQQALQYQKAGDWQKAEALCHQVLQKQPKNDSALNFYKQLSAALNSKGRTTEALAYLQRALSFNPNHAEMQNDLGIIFGQQGKLDQAKACFEKAIAGKKDFVQAYYNLGIILNGEEQFAQAITCYQKALSITPNYADAYNNLGNALSGQNKFSEAIINYQKAVALNPNYAEAHNNLGVAFKKQGQITESIACFKQAIDLKGNYTDAENNLAVTLNEQRQFEPNNANSYGGLTGASNNTPWKVVNGYPIEGVPPDFELPPIVGENNDYSFIEEKRKAFVAGEQPYTLPVSIIIPVYNRKEKLAKTLAAITHQTYPANLIEVIVADDGSSDGVEEVIEKYQKYLSLKSVRQDDQGYRLSAVRNLGLNLAQYDHISILDCDILPTPKYLELLMQYFHVTDKAALMGHRRFVCTDNIADDQILADVNIALNLPDVMPSDKNDRPKKEGEPIIDHRFRLYEKNDYLKQSLFPFSAFYGCSMTFPKKVIGEVGPFDEDFQAWGHEDVEMGYRIYNAGYYFIPVLEAMGLHQEPPGGENESNRSEGLQITNHLLAQKCPIARQYQANVVYEIPKVSIYMAAYNAEKYIKRAVDSALAQTYTDLEVCIVNDGSTDNTLKVLEQNYQNNPRVRWISQKNSGVANTFNAAVGLCRGMYLAHLDADDILLRLDAVEIMVKYLDTYNVGCLYSSCHMIDVNNMTTGKWDSFPVFCREKFINSMIVSHFRLFRKRDWTRLDSGFDKTFEYAEDYDLFLRLSEICPFHHIQEVFYGYRLHGENASIVFQEKQTEHHNLIIQQALKRNGMDKEWEAYVPDPKKPRTTLFRKKVLDAQAESSVVDKLYEYALAYPNSRQNIQEIHDAFSLVEGVKPRGDYLYAERQQLIPLFKAKILYTFLPKCACTSIKHLIFECERGIPYVEKKKVGYGIHEFYKTWREITTNYVYSDNWLKVLIVREPLQRLVSCYKNRVLFHKDLLKSADRLSKVSLPVNPSWEVFIDNFERYRSLSPSINHHSAPIVDFAGYNPDFYDLILNISELDKLLSVVSDRSHCHIEMPHKQIGGSEIDIGGISEKAKEKIHRFYAKDYDIYSKYFGSASQDLMKVKNKAFKQPDQGHPQDYIFVLSHMRSYSSLLCHILGSHSEISGYSEMHSSYLELSDLLTLKQKVAVATDNHLPNRFVLDKILNPSVNTSESILNNEHVHVIFLLRNPEDTIKSIINMGINLNVGAQMEWCKDVEKVLVYYINRLKQIENYSLKMQKSALFIASEKILDDSEQTLKQLTGFLGLKTKLEKDYSIFKYTGLRGHGDPSAVIKEGKMIHQKSHYDIHIPSYILAQAQKSYDNCYRVLSKHPDSQTRESYHSYHDVLPKHLLFQSKNMNDTVIQSLWIGNKLSKLEQLSIASFLYHGHQFHLYTYNDISGIPDGTQLKDANEIILERDIFTYYNGSYAGFADWFRWALLFKNGNFWVDTDVICLKPFNFDTNLIFGFSNVNIVGPAVLGFPPKHDLCRFLENNCRNPNTFLPYDSKKIKDKKLKRRLLGDKRSHIDWGEAGGPVGFTQALKHFNLLHLAKPFTYFFPIPYTNWDYVFDETLAHETELFSNSYAIHLYNEMMRRKKDFDKNASFPELSLIEQLKKKYL